MKPVDSLIGCGNNLIPKYSKWVRHGLIKLAGVGLLLPTAILIAACFSARAQDGVAKAGVIVPTEMPLPDYLETVFDPAFHTAFKRVTGPEAGAQEDLSCSRAYCTHRYSSAQAWNADQSLLLITNGCNGWCFLDGQSHQPLFRRPIPNACEWHPMDPRLMICVRDNEIFTWAPRSDQKFLIWRSASYFAFEFGPGKGNPSKDGNRIALRAQSDAGEKVVFAFDISTINKYPDIRLNRLSGENDHVSISPSGEYIFFFQEPVNGIETSYVFTIDGDEVQHWMEHHRPGHGDMMIDADGNDVYVGISKSDPDKYHIIKRRLKDGKVTSLTPRGEGTHVSLRNINRPGWIFVSYGGEFTDFRAIQHDFALVTGRTPFVQEVVALRTDGSGDVRRIGHTRNQDHDYWSETHASPSPDGSQVIWSSNWGRAGGPVSDFVSRLSWPDEDAEQIALP